MPRRVGREGRAITKSFSYPKNIDNIIEEVEIIARREGVSFSEVIVSQLKDYVKEHSKSQNPQTEITLFETGIENAIPNLYHIIKNPKILDKFYKLIKKFEDFKEIDEGLNIWMNKHNKKFKEFS